MKLLYLLIHIGKVPNFSIRERPAGDAGDAAIAYEESEDVRIYCGEGEAHLCLQEL